MRSLIGAIVGRAGPPVPYSSRRWSGSTGLGGSIFGMRSSRTDHLQATAGNGTLFGVVDALCEKTAAVTWELWAEAKSGKPEDRTPVLDHPILDLWNMPNKHMHQRLFVEIMQQYLELTGEAPMVVVKAGKIPLELWPIRPDRLTPVPDADKFLAGFIYSAPDGEKVPLDVDQVIRLMKPDPDNIHRGLGPVQALMRVLDSARYSEEWNRRFFLNDAMPGGVIEIEESLSPNEYRDFRDRWAETHRGVDNAHRVAILENGAKWVDRKFSVRDMQFAELAGVGDSKILTAYRMPKFGVGQIDDVNRATAEASEYTITSGLIVPRLDRWKDALNLMLAPMYGTSMAGLTLDYAEPIKPNQETENATLTARANAAAALIPVGFDGNSVVKAFDLPETLIWEKPEPPEPPSPSGAGKSGDDEDARAVARHHEPDWRSALLPRNEVPPDLAGVQDEWLTEMGRLQPEWERAYAEQLDDLERQVAAAVDQRNPVALAVLTVAGAAGATLLASAMTSLAATAAATVVREAIAQGVAISAGAADVGELKTIADVTSALLGQDLAAGVGREALRLYTTKARGVEVAAQVRALYESVPANHTAQLGGALTRAQNAGRIATFAAAPVARYYAVEVLDKNTCKPCKQIDGQELPTLDAMNLAYGGGPYLFCQGTWRCRGTAVAVWGDAERPADIAWDDLVRGLEDRQSEGEAA